MDRKLIINYLYNILYQLVKIALPVIIVPYTMSHLGVGVLGISDFAGNIANWFMIFGVLGVNLYGNREIAKVRDNKEMLSRTFFEVLSMRIVNLSFACILYLVYVWLFVSANQTIYYLYVISIFATAFEIIWFYYGIEDFKAASLRNIAVKIVGVIFIVLLVKKPDDLWLFVVINGLSEVFGLLIMFKKLRKHVDFVKINIVTAFKKHFIPSFMLFIPTIAISVYTLLDQTMLGVLTDNTSNVALYKASQGFVKMFLYFVTSIGAIMLPRMTNVYYNKGGKKAVTGYINVTNKLALFLAIPMMVGMITMAPFFIPWYLPGQPEIATLIQISSPIVVCIALSDVFGNQYLIPTGRTKDFTKTVMVGALVNFAINLILIPQFTFVGAAIGSVIAEFSVTFTQYIMIKNEIKVSWGTNIYKYIIAAVFMGIVVVVIGNSLEVRFTSNVIQVLAGIATYASVLLLLKEQLLISTIKKVVNRNNA